ncbi:hypothetical protein M4R22_08010 [Acidovorax sp. GBBC 3334]|uniref:hypothetical protein n=1 Tax=Acidovorax sp. GBBC 3334 TaxID=2940496 RepID=UPI0023021819|nr:hypothetical protein [Acidovorax sp. GBBC 3334]MDA8454704.1 hypothetical protein [Acidovorax sp. GBBC 3334]
MPSKISLQIKHDSHNLEELAVELNLPIARIWTAGAERKSVNGNLLGGNYDESYLALKIESQEETISKAIAIIQERFLIMTNKASIIFTDPNLHKTLYCTVISGGERLEFDSLKKLIDLGIILEID